VVVVVDELALVLDLVLQLLLADVFSVDAVASVLDVLL
jgi:hypothetical protein